MYSFFKTVEKRYSVRSFLEKPIEKSKVKKILDVSQKSPSAIGLQSYKVFLVDNVKKKEKLVDACHDQDYVNAPLLLVFCTDSKKIKKEMGVMGERLFSVQDATIAASYVQLAATALGLSSVWIGNFNEKQVAKIINTKLRPVALIPIGYEKKLKQPQPPAKKKKFHDMIKKV